ncbi:hypothetical protein [Microbacterium sp. bgisy189]|jgi:uncharacterized membrane protein YagU involved in acid resistance|uniref:hypothetical protein n=1 Tax=Microbacterium sp. bgisy189 TaxID=3413798 RepID=UPI003EBB7F68
MTTSTSSSTLLGTRGTATFWQRVLAGVVGGVAGGLVFGMLMAVMGMLPMIAMMVGSDVAAVGFGIHMMISIIIGLGLTVLFGNLLLTGYLRGLIVGMVYGAIWWVLGPLVIMPMMMGMPLFTIDSTALFSLMGHVIYGGILGVVAVAVLARRR